MRIIWYKRDIEMHCGRMFRGIKEYKEGNWLMISHLSKDGEREVESKRKQENRRVQVAFCVYFILFLFCGKQS